ncbi:hypothetical protein EVA_21818, partial [gut metagenome]
DFFGLLTKVKCDRRGAGVEAGF